MNKKILLVLTIMIGFLLLTGCANQNSQNPQVEGEKDEQIILYYGINCPYCDYVEKFIAQNKIDEKVNLIRKEVYHNQANALELSNHARICGLPSNQIGVPFLWDGKNCLMGSQDIIEFFQK